MTRRQAVGQTVLPRPPRRGLSCVDSGRSASALWIQACAVAISVVVHASLLGLLFLDAPAPQRIEPTLAITVNLVEPPEKLRPAPIVDPPKRRPVTKVRSPQPKRPMRIAEPMPVSTPKSAPIDIPADASIAPVLAATRDVPADERGIEAAPESGPIVAASTHAPTPAPAAPPVVEPRFDVSYLNNAAPAYPRISRRLGEEGRVLLRVHVDRLGMPTAVEVRTSSGYDRLDTVALETVRRWKFVPARRGETPVDAWVIVPIVFHLRG